jgi:DNA-binding transcriptional ArsR family regulator
MDCNPNDMLDGRTHTSQVQDVSKQAWRLFCSHGTVLFYIARHPDCTISDIADALVVTPRTVWGLIGDLKRAGLVNFRREGKRHQYTVNRSGRFPDPLISHLTLDQALKAIGGESDQDDHPQRAAASGPARPANANVKALLEGAPLCVNKQ